MNKPNIHVIRRDQKWAVKRENVNGYAATFDTQEDASLKGRELAKEDEVDFFLHAEDGTVAIRDSYGHDSKNVAS